MHGMWGDLRSWHLQAITVGHCFAREQIYVLARLQSGRIVGGCRFDLSSKVRISELVTFFKPSVCNALDASMQNILQISGHGTGYTFRPMDWSCICVACSCITAHGQEIWGIACLTSLAHARHHISHARSCSFRRRLASAQKGASAKSA